MRHLLGIKYQLPLISRYYSQKHIRKLKCNVPTRIRNLGVLAHIDAGKTTTTERMLYYAGSIRSMGEVHRGNTVTDFMDEERLRGITIAAVCVCFPWSGCRFHLVDTPGHIDFTMEVEQSLSVIDGAVVILDGSAGVEAQTTTVWRQADRHRLPRLVFCNKMDRGDADFDMCVESLRTKLQATPLPLQMPSSQLGVIDLVNMCKMVWNPDTQGRTFSREGLGDLGDEELWQESVRRRAALVEAVANLDDGLAEIVIAQDSHCKVSASQLEAAVRRVTLARTGVPVLLGSAYKNVGVQSLMDAVVSYLPAPEESNLELASCFGDKLCARAFKVVHDDQKRLQTFVRVYSGQMEKGQKLHNASQGRSEQVSQLSVPYADQHEVVSQVSVGHVAVVSGLKHTRSGDLLTASASSGQAAALGLAHVRIPEPVFMCAIEPPSQAYQQQLDTALGELQREDPSLQVTQNAETGQTVLGGMGELHLEIVRNRILTEYKIDVELGPMQIAYREALVAAAKETLESRHKIGSTRHSVKVTLSAKQHEGGGFLLDRGPDSAANLAAILPRHLQAVKHGVETALAHGPKLNCPLVDARVTLHWLDIGRGTSDSMVSAAVSQCLRQVFRAGGTCLLQPIMRVDVTTPADRLSTVLADLTRRGGVVEEVGERGVTALAPLASLLGYATALRTATSGTASFTMQFHEYQTVGPRDVARVVQEVTGFAPS